MEAYSDVVNQFVNSTIISLFILGVWLMGGYLTEDTDVFGERANDDWILTVQDEDGNNEPDSGDSATLSGGALSDEGLMRHIALLKIQAFSIYITIFSVCMLGQRFTPKQRSTIPPEILEKLRNK